MYKNGKVVKTLPVIQNGKVDLIIPPGAVQLQKADGGVVSFQNYISSSNRNYLPMDGEQGSLTWINPIINAPSDDTVMWRYLSKDGVYWSSKTGHFLLRRFKVNWRHATVSGM